MAVKIHEKRTWVRHMIEDTTPCSVENTEEDDAEEKKQHKKFDVATAKYNPFSVNNEQKSNLEGKKT